jgi:16S rRNA (cytosine967-C5)-methyltransferase
MPLEHLSPDAPRSSARVAALAVLLACRSDDKAFDDEMEKSASEFRLDARDRALAMELAYGVLRRLEFIDWRLAPVLKKPLPRLPVAVQMLVRLGAYQLLFLTRIPASAAVDESVRLAKSYATRLRRDWSGFVNAVLRNLIRASEPALPDPAIDPAHALSVCHSIPPWLCQRWMDRLGFEQAEAACRAAGSVPAVTVRVNQLRSTRERFLDRLRREGIAARPAAVSPVGVVLEKGGAVTSLPGFQEGDFYIEDEAAQLISPLLDPQPGDLVLDVCAAPGGKTTHLAELMKNCGRILAMDRQRARLDLLQDNCRRLGITIVTAVEGDARRRQDILRTLGTRGSQSRRPLRVSDGSVDRILLDAPCSGLGVLRRHPEAKWHKHPALFSRHRHLQVRILESVAAVLRPGGALVYSTCSTEREETEDVIEYFCRAYPDWVRESVEPWLPSTALSFVTAQGAFSTMGNKFGMDGFYAVRLRRVS